MAKSKKVLDKSSSSRPETHRICNVVPSRNTENDWAAEDAIAAGAAAAPLTRRRPASIFAIPGGTSAIRRLTGSCVGWGSTDGVARYHFVKANRLAQNAKLSPRVHLDGVKGNRRFRHPAGDVYRRRRHQPEGRCGHPAQVRRCARDAAALPHPARSCISATRTPSSPPRPRGSIASYFNLQQQPGELALVARARMGRSWSRSTSTRPGTMRPRPMAISTPSSPTPSAVAMLPAVVGYTADKRFIIRNSWGTAWGDHGFAYASEAYINAAFFNESYGVTL